MDLPLHPLVVHAAVVLVPLAAVLVITAVFWARVRVQVGAVGAVLALLGTVSFFVAHRSGSALAEIVGTPYAHMAWADPALAAAVVFGVLAVAWYVQAVLLHRAAARDTAPARGRTIAERVTGILASVAGVVACVFTFLVGHSGAEEVWSGVAAAVPA
ncbi:DUF2231 domain-containing protein [Microbacterium chocolatum]|uniref:DUF2231 domain-containing protein n=1 Tax=Microbacterium aurantiacum TaxID=162393 RepID=UPI00338DC6C4